MSYQVFARKWRPQSFSELVGQNHVMTALTHALNHQRLHHAYLFTGTRGVGKTTIARIFAKCLSCETGITATPCGQCESCTSITAGRYIDLLEVDAASRTKVEDTRDLLENVQYAPTQGRFKIYLIDEVHMLSTGSFNALLKTLEEPPEHVKFLLATTDPQKLPVTVLSRCLQFNLKRMPIDMITEHLESVLTQENIPYHINALRELARAADGSMRDALSLLDQAVAFGQGRLDNTNVQEMLGGASQYELYQLLQAIAAHNGKQMLAIVEQMANHTPDYELITDDLISLLHQIAVQQIVPQPHSNNTTDKAITQLAQQIPAEDLQLYYQIALQGRADLAYAPDPRCGFEMLLLRMLAFHIAPKASAQNTAPPTEITPPTSIPNQPSIQAHSTASKKKTITLPTTTEQTNKQTNSTPSPTENNQQTQALDDMIAEITTTPTTTPKPKTKAKTTQKQAGLAKSLSNSKPNTIADAKEPQAPIPDTNDLGEYWHQLLPQLTLDGMTKELARHGLLNAKDENHWQITLSNDAEHFHNDNTEQALLSALQTFTENPDLRIKLHLSDNIEGELPVNRAKRIKLEQQQLAENMIKHDTFVNHLISQYNAKVIPQSITYHPKTK
jgi:DNA polymerase-3 subunit gamma/tau